MANRVSTDEVSDIAYGPHGEKIHFPRDQGKPQPEWFAVIMAGQTISE